MFYSYSDATPSLHLMLPLLGGIPSLPLVNYIRTFSFSHSLHFPTLTKSPLLSSFFISSLFLTPHILPTFLISLAKSEGSSPCKGKGVVIDYPPFNGKGGEKVPPSKSDHFEEEGVAHDPNSECPPLREPWNDVHPHFPEVASDFLHPPSNCVWLSLE